MKRLFKLSTFLMVCLSVACNQMTPDETNLPLQEIEQKDLRIEPGTTPITAEQAVNVAKIFDVNQGRPNTKGTSTISDVFTVFNSEGMPVFYAVNRTNKGGFVIISASRKYYPILAYVEKGHYGEEEEREILYEWTQDQVGMISAIEKGDIIVADVDFSVQWSLYEKQPVSEIMKTKTEAEAFALRQSSVAAWEAQGYTCYALDECPKNLPSSVYNSWCSLASIYANTNYSYLLYSVILQRQVVNTTTYGPLMGSTWGQDNGYNASIPHLMYVGCVPVAVGQIMRYHEKPSSFSWSYMPLSYPTTTTANFLYTLGSYMGIDYQNYSSAATHQDAIDTFDHYGYTSDFDLYNQSTVMSNIMAGKPVYVAGSTNANGAGHAWVCEGYSYSESYEEYQLMVISQIEPPLHYESITSNYVTGYGQSTYLYHNLGYEGDGDGWYIGHTFNTSEGTFTALGMIYDITPPTT